MLYLTFQNGVGSNGGSCSRFSQWFKRESPVQQVDSRRTSIQDDILNNLLNDITEPNIQIPSVTESNAYFAPISPANTTTTSTAASSTGVKLLEMLQRGNKPSQNGQGDAASTVVPLMKNTTIKDMGENSRLTDLFLIPIGLKNSFTKGFCFSQKLAGRLYIAWKN